MRITATAWAAYTQQLAKLNKKAGQLMADYIAAHGTGDTDALIAYAHALVTKYGEGQRRTGLPDVRCPGRCGQSRGACRRACPTGKLWRG